MRCRRSTRTLRLVGKLRVESDGQKKGGDCITPALGTPERVSYFFLAFFLVFFAAVLAFFLRFATIFASSLFRGSALLATREPKRESSFSDRMTRSLHFRFRVSCLPGSSSNVERPQGPEWTLEEPNNYPLIEPELDILDVG